MTRRSCFLVNAAVAVVGVVVVLALAGEPRAAAQYAQPQEAPSIRPRQTGRRGTGGGTPSDTRGTFQIDSALSVVSDDNPDGDDGFTLFSMLFGFRYDIVPVFELEVQGGFSLISPDAGDTEVNLSNILVSGFYVLRGPSWRFRIGGGIGLPTAQIDEDDLVHGVPQFINLFYAGGQRGVYDFAIWFPETLSFQVPTGRFVYNVSPQITLMAEAALTIFVDVSDNLDRNTEVGLQVAGDFGFHPSDVISLGVRLNTVFVDYEDTVFFDNDEFQASLEPHFRVNFGAGFFFARVTINLDHPFGFAFDDQRLWAIHLGGGADF